MSAAPHSDPRSNSGSTHSNIDGKPDTPTRPGTQHPEYSDIDLRGEIARCHMLHQKECEAREAAGVEYVDQWSPVVNCTKSDGRGDWVQVFEERCDKLCDYFKSTGLDLILGQMWPATSPQKWALDLFGFTLAGKKNERRLRLEKINEASKDVDSGPLGDLLTALSELKIRIEKAAFERADVEVIVAWDRMFVWGYPNDLARIIIEPDGAAEEWIEKYLADWVQAIAELARTLAKHFLLYTIAEPIAGLPEFKVKAWHTARLLLQTALVN